MMIRKLLTTTVCTRRFPPPYFAGAAPNWKNFSSAPSKKPSPSTSPPPKSSSAPAGSPPQQPEAHIPNSSQSVIVNGAIVGLVIGVVAAGYYNWRFNRSQDPREQTISDVGGDVLGKSRQEEGNANTGARDFGIIVDEHSELKPQGEDVVESYQDESEVRKNSLASENEHQFHKDHKAHSEDAVKSVGELSREAEDGQKEVAPSGLDALLKLLEDEGKTAANSTHTDKDVELESCSPDSSNLEDSSQVPMGETHQESSPSTAHVGVSEKFAHDENDRSLGSHADSGKGETATEGEADGKDGAHSATLGLPDGNILVRLHKDKAERENGESVLERDTAEANAGIVASWGLLGKDDSQKITQDVVQNLKEKQGEAQLIIGEANRKDSASVVPGGFSEEFLLLRAHEDNVKTFQGKEDGNTTASTTSQQSREPLPQVEPDFLVGAIHTAVQKQAETDAREFNISLGKLREEHATELKDAIAKELMYAEEADRLQKELEKEQRKAEERVRLLQKIADERLKSELKRKEDEAKKILEEAHNFAKLQAKAIVVEERAAHLEQLKDVKLQVDALRTAFYTRSEEARKSHTAHKLSMGAFAFENAMRSGAPVLDEAILLIASAGGPGQDPVLDAALSSIPAEVFQEGTKTRAQLHQKFNKMKGPLRELVLIPAGSGGVLTHLLARLAANIKVSEQSPYIGGEGVESVIGQVENYLAEGKLAEAADVLEKEAAGTKAEELAAEWARQARTRAIMEQALQLIQSHAVAIASSLA